MAPVNLYSVNILSSYGKKADLITYLNQLHKSLNGLSQDVKDRPKGLKNIALQLIAPKILEHSDKDVRLLATCCVVDMLRIFAPEAPYSPEDTVKVFEVIVAQLRGLSTYDLSSTVGIQIFYILNSISSVKSCVVPVILAQNNVDGAEEVVVSLFEAILSSIRVEHSQEVFSHCSEILQSCIEEFEDISQDVLDILLFPLLSSSKVENPAAYRLVGVTLRRVSANIEIPVSSFINNCLVGNASSVGGGKGSDLSEHIHTLIYELHIISSSLLSRVIPNVCIQLQAEEEEVRLKAVQLLGSLLASQWADYAADFPRNFKDFLGRFQDLSVVIRQTMVDSCCRIGDSKPQLNAAMEEPLAKRLRDPDSDIRQSALKRLLTMGQSNPLGLSVTTLQEIGERVKDKKPDIRRAALSGLAKMYFQQLSSRLPPLSSLLAEDQQYKDLSKLVRTEVMERFGSVPALIVKSWGYPELGNKHLILQLLQEYVLPKSLKAPAAQQQQQQRVSEGTSEEEADSGTNATASSLSDDPHEVCDVRATALLILYGLLEEEDRTALGAILGFKSKVRGELKRFLDTRVLLLAAEQGKNGTSSNTAVHSVNLRQSVGRLVQLVPTVDKKTTCFDKLHAVKDKIVFRLLSDCVAARDSITSAMAHREDLKKRLDSKSAVGEYFGLLYDLAGGLVVNSRMVESLLSFVIHSSVHERTKMPIELLTLLSKHNVQSFHGCADKVGEWLTSCINFEASSSKSKLSGLRDDILHSCISILQNTSSVYAGDAHHHQLCAEIVKHVKSSTQGGLCESLAELVALLALQSDDPSAVGGGRASKGQSCMDLCNTLVNHLSSDRTLSVTNTTLHSDLSALAALVKIPALVYKCNLFHSPLFLSLMRTVKSIQSKVLDFVTLLLFDNPPKKVAKRDVLNICAALKVAAQLITTSEELRQLAPVMKVEDLVDGPTESSSSSSSSSKKGGAKKSTTTTTSSLSFSSIMELLFSCIKGDEDEEEEGNSFSEKTVGNVVLRDAADWSSVFDAAALSLVGMVKLQRFSNTISVGQWQWLGWSFLHASEEGKGHMLALLTSIMQTHPLHPKFLAYPCLYATSVDESLVASAESSLMFVVNRLHRTLEELSSRIVAAQNSEETKELQKMVAFNMPESIFPYFVHLLSYHPEFPRSSSLNSEDDKRRTKVIVRCVKMILKILQSSSPEALSYILKQVNLISVYHDDAQDPENVGPFFVSRIAAKLLMEQVKTSDNIQYQGDIALPSELFRQRSKPNPKDTGYGEFVRRQNRREQAEKALDQELRLSKVVKRAGATVPGGSPSHPTAAKRAGGAAGEEGPARKKRGAAKKVAESEGESDEEEEDEQSGEDENRKGSNTGKNRKRSLSNGGAPASPTNAAVVPTRAVPRRTAKAAVASYAEPEENDRETDKWNKEAGVQNESKKRHSSGSAHSASNNTSINNVLSPIKAVDKSNRLSGSSFFGWEEEEKVEEAVVPVKKGKGGKAKA